MLTAIANPGGRIYKIIMLGRFGLHIDAASGAAPPRQHPAGPLDHLYGLQIEYLMIAPGIITHPVNKNIGAGFVPADKRPISGWRAPLARTAAAARGITQHILQ